MPLQRSGPIDACDVPSPCLKVCKMGTAHLCVGCFRTIEEIAGWASMDAEQRIAVLFAAKSRQSRA
jgi:predicted Fe-S protein YdhL (DUF1289 family)